MAATKISQCDEHAREIFYTAVHTCTYAYQSKYFHSITGDSSFADRKSKFIPTLRIHIACTRLYSRGVARKRLNRSIGDEALRVLRECTVEFRASAHTNTARLYPSETRQTIK